MSNRGWVIALLVLCVMVLVWWLMHRLSSDAIAMAIGLTLGVAAMFVPYFFIGASRRRDEEDEYIDMATMPTVYSDEVSPYSRIARRVIKLPQLPDRQTQIMALRSELAYLEGEA